MYSGRGKKSERTSHIHNFADFLYVRGDSRRNRFAFIFEVKSDSLFLDYVSLRGQGNVIGAQKFDPRPGALYKSSSSPSSKDWRADG